MNTQTVLPLRKQKQVMAYHPMRRDLWTDPAVNDRSNARWQETTKNHPLYKQSINVDSIAGIPHYPKYRDISDSFDKYVNHVNDNWAGAGVKKAKKGAKARRASPQADKDEEEIAIMFSNTTDGSSKELHIKRYTCLRTLFNDYAEEHDTPLRSLRFTLNGSTLFMSSLGRKTAKDLNLAHLDCISVTNIQEVTSSPSYEEETPKKPKQNSSKKGSGKKHQKKKRGSKPSKAIAKLYETEEKAKESHSISLSKIFEEAEPIFKAIRQGLNNLTLEKKSPKTRRSSSCRTRDDSQTTVVFNPNTFGLGGKAGKSLYTVNVGQVENLYISSKRYSIHSKTSSRQRPSIDLHGCTKDEAVEKLDEALVDWVDTAMKGEYPWVISVEIICGGGNQILSETVESWVRSKKNVANAPKGQ